MSSALIVQGRMNYDELVRRMEYWTFELSCNDETRRKRAVSALQLMAGTMKRCRTAMFLEETPAMPLKKADTYKVGH